MWKILASLPPALFNILPREEGEVHMNFQKQRKCDQYSPTQIKTEQASFNKVLFFYIKIYYRPITKYRGFILGKRATAKSVAHIFTFYGHFRKNLSTRYKGKNGFSTC